MKSTRTTLSTAACLVGLAMILTASPATADHVILDDCIIDGSLCVGFDCVNGESFGFDTIRLKENNLRIHFLDTSTAASFPPNDWRIVINDSANGGASYFAVEDSSAARQVFRIAAGARSNALTVDSAGDVGIGTLNAAVDLHIKTGDTPTLRLEQDGTSGFAPQTWDVAGNETNFFVRDVTSGSTLPLRIRPGAPTSTVDIGGSGNVGIGAQADSDVFLHVKENSGVVRMKVETGSANNARLILKNSVSEWDFRNNTVGQFAITLAGSVTSALLIDDGNENVTITNDLIVSGVGGCTGCDEVFDPGYYVPPIEEHAAEMWQNGYLPGIGPSPVEEPINVFRKTAGILNELEKAHIYIEQLNERLKMLEAELAASRAQ